MRFIFSFVLCTLLVLAAMLPVSNSARAAERPQVILVLDASGSMWQRVDNREKILIAREVIGSILDEWDPSIELGLVAYGHRRKGDCNDIETLVPLGLLPLGTVNIAAVRNAVNKIQPKGKTPLSAAVQKAARDLRYTEEKATVILISDGKETCDMDPCAVGRELEATGVDFTAHVIGFDISEDERKDLQCLAEATGGRYFDARKAEELQLALATAVEESRVEADRVVAVLAEGQPPLTGVDIRWSAQPADGGEALTGSGDSFSFPSVSGSYTVTARLDQAQGSGSVEIVKGESRQHVVLLDAGRLLLQASASGPGGDIPDPEIKWSIQNLAEETEAASATGPAVSLYLNSQVYGVFASYGDETKDRIVRLEPGAEQEVSFEFAVSPARLTAPEQAPAGSSIDVAWGGPGGKNDFITVVPPEAEDREHGNYVYTRKGNPVELLLPDEAGSFELRYVDGKSRSVLARRPITISEITASLNAPESTPAGKIIRIEWQGPDNKNDFITVVTPETDEGKHGNYVYTRKGSPAELQMPDQPGLYELRYVSGQSRTVLARWPITVSEISATLRALDIVPVGEEIRLQWEGPDNKNDYLSVAEPGSADNKYVKYVYTRRGNPAALKMPDVAGLYELRYVTGQSRTVLARRPIEVVSADDYESRLAKAPQGEVTLRVLDPQTGEPLKEGPRWTIYGLTGGDRGLRQSNEPQPTLSVPPGVYRANVNVGGVSASLDFIVNPGERIVHDIMLP